MIYFILSHCGSCGAQLLKVGKANSVDQRFCFLRRENAVELTLLGRLPGDEELEREIHAELGESVHNEWFPYDAAARKIVSRYLDAGRELAPESEVSMELPASQTVHMPFTLDEKIQSEPLFGDLV